MLLVNLRKGLNVRRFHTEPLIREDTNGHHSANVAALVLWLMHPTMPSAELLRACVLHDVAEYETGDMPAQMKWDNPLFHRELHKTEEALWQEVKWDSPTSPLSSDELNILKFCDSMDCGLKVIEEARMGNTILIDILHRILLKIEDALASCPLDSQFQPRANKLVAACWEQYHDFNRK